MSVNDFWTHGVQTVVEYPQRCREIRPAGWGMLVAQPYRGDQRDNWFHLPLFSPSKFKRTSKVYLVSIRVDAEVNYAQIVEVHVRENDRLIFGKDVQWPSDREARRRTDVSESLTIGDRRGPGRRRFVETNHGLALCLRVLFLNGALQGTIVFRGASVRLDF